MQNRGYSSDTSPIIAEYKYTCKKSLIQAMQHTTYTHLFPKRHAYTQHYKVHRSYIYLKYTRNVYKANGKIGASPWHDQWK